MVTWFFRKVGRGSVPGHGAHAAQVPRHGTQRATLTWENCWDKMRGGKSWWNMGQNGGKMAEVLTFGLFFCFFFRQEMDQWEEKWGDILTFEGLRLCFEMLFEVEDHDKRPEVWRLWQDPISFINRKWKS